MRFLEPMQIFVTLDLGMGIADSDSRAKGGAAVERGRSGDLNSFKVPRLAEQDRIALRLPPLQNELILASNHRNPAKLSFEMSRPGQARRECEEVVRRSCQAL